MPGRDKRDGRDATDARSERPATSRDVDGWVAEACHAADGRRLEALRALERGDMTSATSRALGRRLLDAGLAHPRPEPLDALPDITVVIPVRDRPEELDRCLAALDRDVKVIVVDDGSRDDVRLASVAARHGATLLRRDSPGGPAAARNAPIHDLTSELVAFLDSDCVPSRGWLQALAGHFEDPLVGAAAPRVRPSPGYPLLDAPTLSRRTVAP